MSNGANSKESFGAIILDGAGKYLKARASMIVCGILIGILGISIVIVASILVPPKYTQITSIAEYGNYSGTENEQIPRQIISSFFPEKIEPYFSDVVYSYKAENIDYYGFEAYLE